MHSNVFSFKKFVITSSYTKFVSIKMRPCLCSELALGAIGDGLVGFYCTSSDQSCFICELVDYSKKTFYSYYMTSLNIFF